MNVTLGVPRIKEIMNASREISTPIIEAPLENDDSEVAARVVKARIEKTTLGDIAISISEVYAPEGAHLEVKLDLGTIEALHLEGIDAHSIKAALEQAPKLHLKDGNVRVTDADTVLVIPPPQKSASRLRAERSKMREMLKEKDHEISHVASVIENNKKSSFQMEDSDAIQQDMGTLDNDGTEAETDYFRPSQIETQRTTGGQLMERSDLYFVIQGLKASLPKVIIQGIPEVSRAVITRSETASKSTRSKPSTTSQPLKLLVEGNNLLRVMGVPGVRGTETTSNHVMEVEGCLGIEAARVMIQTELARTYKSYGIVVDSRHLQLLSDIMTYKGAVLGITRFGIAKMKESVLMLASFEKTPDHLFDAAVHARIDPCVGVSESIILGTPIPLGTGLFSLVGNI
jgi:DNA-directed RNA polymerase III subunit RPC1